MIQKLLKLLQIEQKRYKKKGISNILIALSLLFGVMYASFLIGRMYWPEQVQDKMWFVTLWSIGLNLSVSVAGFMLYLPGYLGWSNFFKQHLVNKKASRPWQRKNWVQVRSKMIVNIIINQIILYPIIIYLTNLQGIQLRFQSFPNFTEFSLQILFIYYFQDLMFYIFHRTFHTFTALYRFHKVHHQYDVLYTWVAEYLHPVDFVFANLLPAAVPLMLLGNRLHCFTFFFWVFYKVILSLENHSGYEFEFSPLRVFPLIANTAHHDHHHSMNVGNFGGTCYHWDLFFDSYVQYTPDF